MFSIQESLRYGWEKFKNNMQLSLLATLLTVVIGLIGDQTHWFIMILLTIVSIIIRIGYTKIFLRMSEGETPKFIEIFKEYRFFWKYLGTSILQGLIMIGGFILLIIPGIIWSVRFSFAPLILIDANTRPIESLKESYAITKDKFWKLFGFYVVIGLINIVGFIALGVGLLVSIPVSMFAQVYVYRELTKSKAGVMVENTSPQVI